jgi:hypothetical protein
MLGGIIQEEHRELIRMKDHFAETYLSRGESFAEKRINQERIDAMINECWELAGTEVGQRKKTSVPQGGPRNNMRSQLTNVLETILRWYVLDEESSGQTQCTEQGWAL